MPTDDAAAARRTEIARHEDFDTTNPYIVIACLKPGPFRPLDSHRCGWSITAHGTSTTAARAYGRLMSDDEALQPGPPDEDIGLRFVCLNANISRQFEFVQTAWVASTKFGGLTQESDPLLGNRQPIRRLSDDRHIFDAQPSGTGLRLRDMPQFVTVSGGAYFFLPSLSALRYLDKPGRVTLGNRQPAP